MTGIKRLILDVLKPHEPSIIDISEKLAGLHGVAGVNCMLEEVDQETEDVKITIEGLDIEYDQVKQTLENMGAVIHSIDGVSAGKRLVEEVETPQDR